MEHTPASGTAGLSLSSCRGETFAQGSSALLREHSVQLLTLLFQYRLGDPAGARPSKYYAASVPIRVTALTLAATIAAVTSGLASGTRYRIAARSAAVAWFRNLDSNQLYEGR
jgi:hypothetical protein